MLNKIGKVATENSPVILTGIGVAGVVSVAVLTGKATFKAAELIRVEEEVNQEEEGENYRPLTAKERVRIVWPLYIPPAGAVAVTVTVVVLANRIGTRRAAAMAAAYSISEKAFEEYRDKIIEKVGPNKEREARDEIAQDRVRNNPPSDVMVVDTGDGNYLTYDSFSDRYFRCNKQKIERAEIDIKNTILNHDSACLNEFYSLIGLPGTKYGDQVGWSNLEMIDVTFTSVLSKNDIPCLVFDFRQDPVPNYFRTH